MRCFFVSNIPGCGSYSLICNNGAVLLCSLQHGLVQHTYTVSDSNVMRELLRTKRFTHLRAQSCEEDLNLFRDAVRGEQTDIAVGAKYDYYNYGVTTRK